MAEKKETTSKNNPTKRRIEGWRCSHCGQTNATDQKSCSGHVHTRVLGPVGRGMKARMRHDPCTNSV